MREGESAFYFGEDPGISLSFRLPENRFGEPLNLHKAAIAYSRARSELDLRQKKRLLDSAWEFVQNACPEE